MDGHVILRWVVQMLGIVLMLFILLDVYLTVLYARIGTGILSHHLACWVWRLFRWVSKPFSRSRDTILSFCGPAILVLLVGTWVWGIMLGAAMVMKPVLGTAIRSSTGGA